MYQPQERPAEVEKSGGVDIAEGKAPKAEEGFEAERTCHISEVLGTGYGRGEKLLIPEYLFDPRDNWAVEFRAGLSKLQGLTGSVLFEVGVGVGANIIHTLAAHQEITAIFGSDLDERAPVVAAANVAHALHPRLSAKFIPLLGKHDLLKGAAEEINGRGLQNVDLIFGCLPQVKRPESEPQIKDSLAHYYRPDNGANDVFEQYSLGLNEHLLQQSHEILSPDGRVVLVLAGRPPLNVLMRLFEANGFSPRIIHKAAMEQHAGTSIEKMVEAEVQHGIHFEFHADPSCSDRPFTASIAQKLFLQDGQRIFHTLYVIEGRRTM